MQPLVSVVIPVYNVEKFLVECVESVLGQTYSNIEIILVNDGSTDSSVKICDDYALNHSNINVIHQDDNKGQSEARNAGMKISKGKYVYFMDSDDYIWNDAIEILVNTAEKEQTDIVFFDGCVVEEDGKYSPSKYFMRGYRYPKTIRGSELLRQQFRNGRDYCWSVPLLFIKWEFLHNKGITFYPGIIYEDVLFIFKALIDSDRVLHIPEKLYFRRKRKGSTITSKITEKNIMGYCKVIEEMISFCDSLPKTAQHIEYAKCILEEMKVAMQKYGELDDGDKLRSSHYLSTVHEKMKNSPFMTSIFGANYRFG